MTITTTAGWDAIGTRRQLCGHGVFTIDAPAIGPEVHAPLLVLHGFPTSSFDYAAVLDGLRAGRRVLSFAAQQADIVSINVNLREGTGGPETAPDASPARTREKVSWVKEAAGDRFDDLELNALIGFVMITDDAAGVADAMAPHFGIDPADALHVPLALLGTLDGMAEELEWRRSEYGISYWSIESDAWETLAPVVSKLAGT